MDNRNIECLASDGTWTIGYVDGEPAQWAGNMAPPEEDLTDCLSREDSEFHDGNVIYRVINFRWTEVPGDAGDYIWIIGDDQWGDEVTEAEHEAACQRAEAWLDEHEGPHYSISVRPCRSGEIAGVYAVMLNGNTQILGHSVELPEAVNELTNRAWEHTIQEWPQDSADIEITLHALADEYGVERPSGDRPVRLYRDADGWHISDPFGVLTDAEWAPLDDEQAETVRRHLEP